MKQLCLYRADVYFWDPVYSRQAVKHDVRLGFSNDEYSLLSKEAAERLTVEDGKFYLKPHEFVGAWEDVRDDIRNKEFDCVVLATDHEDFHPMYAYLVLTEGALPIADLRNAIMPWLRKQGFPKEKEEELKNKLSMRSKYMLLGLD
jgi:UDP-N-acetyl-D-mannosaminuronate dehydrogenase